MRAPIAKRGTAARVGVVACGALAVACAPDPGPARGEAPVADGVVEVARTTTGTTTQAVRSWELWEPMDTLDTRVWRLALGRDRRERSRQGHDPGAAQ